MKAFDTGSVSAASALWRQKSPRQPRATRLYVDLQRSRWVCPVYGVGVSGGCESGGDTGVIPDAPEACPQLAHLCGLPVLLLSWHINGGQSCRVARPAHPLGCLLAG